MEKLTKDILGHNVSITLETKKTTGKILAIARTGDSEQVCFQIEEGKVGIWIPALALADSQKWMITESKIKTITEKEITFPTPITEKGKKETELKIKNVTEKERTLPTPITEKVKKETELKIKTVTEKEKTLPTPITENIFLLIRKKAEDDLNLLVKFGDELVKNIDNKAKNDIQLLNNNIQDTLKLGEKFSSEIAKLGSDNLQLISTWLSELNIGDVLIVITRTINNDWNKYWKQRVISSIIFLEKPETKKEKLLKCKNQVLALKKKNPHYSSMQIAQEFIREKTIFSTAVAIIPDGIKKVVEPLVNFTENVTLLTEMLYQIAIAYGFEEVEEGEILGIISLSATANRLRELGLLELLKQSHPINNILISAGTNIALFLLVAYAGCQYYEIKSKALDNPLISTQAYDTFGQKLDIYLTETLSEEKQLKVITEDAIEMREKIDALA